MENLADIVLTVLPVLTSTVAKCRRVRSLGLRSISPDFSSRPRCRLSWRGFCDFFKYAQASAR
jgi:hypothetical protein